MVLAAFVLIASISGCGESDRSDSATPPPKKSVTKSPSKKKATSKAAVSESTSPAANTKAKPDPAESVQKIYRPDDLRPRRNDEQLAQLGFHKRAATHFVLYSDLPEDEIRPLPAAVDQLFAALGDYFGPLPPSRAGNPYRMTGYLMGDQEKFRAANLFTSGPAQPHEGWYLGTEFWWNRQATDYYTRHLMLHEATHCYMHVMPSVDCPPWYVEGMAELFGTHTCDDQGRYAFGIFPTSSDVVRGWGRISVMQEEVKADRLPTLEEVLAFKFDDFTKVAPYAWSWALCQFLNSHPRYKTPFRNVARHMMDGGFRDLMTEEFQPVLADARDEWLLFASQIQYGHDIERSAVEFKPGQPPASADSVSISAARGWQSSGLKLTMGDTYRVRATGRFVLATTSKPWFSEPQGISIRYFAGQPLGRLLGCVRPDPLNKSNRDILKLIPLGPDATFVAPHSGTLYLRLNDAWNELADNSGEVRVDVSRAKP